MLDTFPIYEVTSEFRQREKTLDEVDGYLEKFWIEHPKLGRSLVKFDRGLTAAAWTEKVASEIAKCLNLPCATYEFGVLKGLKKYSSEKQVVLSPDFRQEDAKYYRGVELLVQLKPNSGYQVQDILESLKIANVKLPEDYQAPNGIVDGSDLFVGQLVLDYLVDNCDRHSRNWGYYQSYDNNQRYLCPIYDHGFSLGIILSPEEAGKIDPTKYLEYSKSAFGIKHQELLKQVAKSNSTALDVWLKEIARIERGQFKAIFEKIPDGLVSEQNSEFAQRLIGHNQKKLLELDLAKLL